MSAGARRGSLLFHSRRGGRALAPVVEGVTARCQAGAGAGRPRASLRAADELETLAALLARTYECLGVLGGFQFF